MLYIVSTPIGNLGDITLRAIEILKCVDLIACEDTRRTRILTQHYSIETALTSYFEHNKITKGEYVIRLLKEGKSIALVSDAGTPGINDPGYNIVRLAIENNIPITVAPGPVALISALVLSGKPTDKFVFEGFLSHKSVARRKRLLELKGERRTVILYESPYRLLATLKDIFDIFGDIEVVCAREITKKFEQVVRKKASELVEHFSKVKPRGEFVVIV